MNIKNFLSRMSMIGIFGIASGCATLSDSALIDSKTELQKAKQYADQGEHYRARKTASKKVFSYEPENAETSRLIDEIRKTAMKDGQAEVLVRNKIAREESRERVGAYLLEARKGLQTGRVGAAGLALNKILLLDPENEEALKMRSQL